MSFFELLNVQSLRRLELETNIIEWSMQPYSFHTTSALMQTKRSSYLLDPIESLESLSRNSSFYAPKPDAYAEWTQTNNQRLLPRPAQYDLASKPAFPSYLFGDTPPPSALSFRSNSSHFSLQSRPASVDYWPASIFAQRHNSLPRSDVRTTSGAESASSVQYMQFAPVATPPYIEGYADQPMMDVQAPHTRTPPATPLPVTTFSDDRQFEEQFELDLSPSPQRPPAFLRRRSAPTITKRKTLPPAVPRSIPTSPSPGRRRRPKPFGPVNISGFPSLDSSASSVQQETLPLPFSVQSASLPNPTYQPLLSDSNGSPAKTALSSLTPEYVTPDHTPSEAASDTDFTPCNRPSPPEQSGSRTPRRSRTRRPATRSLSDDDDDDAYEDATQSSSGQKFKRRSEVIRTDSDRRRPGYVRPIESQRRQARERLDALLKAAPGNGAQLRARFPYEPAQRQANLERMGLTLIFSPLSTFQEVDLQTSTRRFRKDQCERLLASLDAGHIYFLSTTANPTAVPAQPPPVAGPSNLPRQPASSRSPKRKRQNEDSESLTSLDDSPTMTRRRRNPSDDDWAH